MQNILHQGGFGDVAEITATSLPLALSLVLLILVVVLISPARGAAMERAR